MKKKLIVQQLIKKHDGVQVFLSNPASDEPPLGAVIPAGASEEFVNEVNRVMTQVQRIQHFFPSSGMEMGAAHVIVMTSKEYAELPLKIGDEITMSLELET